MSTATYTRGRLAAKTDTSRFYFSMSVACLVIAFVGFAPTYWMGLSTGTFKARPIIHVHGIVFFSWTLFVMLQTWLAEAGKLARHRAMGLIAISLATAMFILGVLAAINQMQTAAAAGAGDAGLAFSIVPLGGILFFGITFAIAVKTARAQDWHKRLMLLATISILDAPIARWFLTLLAPPNQIGPPPVVADVGPALVACLPLLVAMVFDWRTRGRPHPAYLMGGAAYLALKLGQVPVSATAWWHSIASAVLALAAP
jgi:hypothetical protein